MVFSRRQQTLRPVLKWQASAQQSVSLADFTLHSVLRHLRAVTTSPTASPATTSLDRAISTEQTLATSPAPQLKYADVGINLSDATYRGVYHGRKSHEDDTKIVVQRALNASCLKLMVTGSDLQESQKAIELAKEYPGICYATVGVHPCSATSFDKHQTGAEGLLQEIESLAVRGKKQGTVSAFGEIGLDYDRLHLAGKEQQLKYFEAQLEIAIRVQLPLFLHSRAAGEDFERLITSKLPLLPKRGLVHSFTGTMAEMSSLVSLGLDIGVNGCSLKTEENLDVVRAMPLDKIQIETDGPWCEMRASQASAKHREGAPPLPRAVKKEKWEKDCMVKGRNEPVAISHVAFVVAKVKGLSVEEVCNAAWTNSIRMFGLGETEG